MGMYQRKVTCQWYSPYPYVTHVSMELINLKNALALGIPDLDQTSETGHLRL